MQTKIGYPFLFLILAFFLFGFKSHQADVAIDLSSSVTSVQPGDEVVFTVSLKNSVPLYGAELHLDFDENLLEVTATESGSTIHHGDLFDPESGTAFVLAEEVNQDEGIINYAAVLIDPAPAIVDGGVLFEIHFQATAVGDIEIKVLDSLLGTKDSQSISHTVNEIVPVKTIGETAVPTPITDPIDIGTDENSFDQASLISIVAGIILVLGSLWLGIARSRKRRSK